MSLEELLSSGLVRRVRPSRASALKALRLAKRDLKTAERLLESRDYDWCLAIAYNAMLQAGRALMYSMGYRPSASHGHVAVLKFLRAAAKDKLGEDLLTLLDRARRKRHRAVYEEAEVASREEAEECLKWASRFVSRVMNVLQL